MDDQQQNIDNLLRSYATPNSMVRHQLDTYNYFLTHMIPNVLREYRYMRIVCEKMNKKHVIEFKNICITKPQIVESDGTARNIGPKEAIDRKYTYSSKVLVDVTHNVYHFEVYDTEKSTTTPTLTQTSATPFESNQMDKCISSNCYQQVELCTIPTMVGSIACHSTSDENVARQQDILDLPGFFIINGSEKVIVAQETLRPNFPYVSRTKKSNKLVYGCEVRSLHESRLRSTSTVNMYLMSPSVGAEIRVDLPFIKFSVALPVIFRLIGVTSPVEMKKMILGDGPEFSHLEMIVRSVIKDTNEDKTINELYEWIGIKGTALTLEKTRRTRSHMSQQQYDASYEMLRRDLHDCKTDEEREQIEQKMRRLERTFEKQNRTAAEDLRAARCRYVSHIIKSEFLPHIGLDGKPQTNMKKAMFVGYMVRKLLLVSMGLRPPDDRDHYANKRLHCTGMLMGLQFRQLWRKMHNDTIKNMRNAINNGQYIEITDAINCKTITSGFTYAFATGKWGSAKGGSTQDGVAQLLANMSFQWRMDHLRRVNTPLNRNGKIPKPRQLDPSTLGLICCVTTPEGRSCGLIKALALTCHIRLGFVSPPLVSLVLSFSETKDIIRCSTRERSSRSTVFVNGAPIALTAKPESVAAQLRAHRRSQDVPFDTSIVFMFGHLWVTSDAGCCLRPLIYGPKRDEFVRTLEDYATQQPHMLWHMMMIRGILEYVDKEEEEFNCVVAVSLAEYDPDVHTHIEIDANCILGAVALLIPFPQHNQAPRLTYSQVMMKQAVSRPIFDHKDRMDTSYHTLWYPQVPLVSTFGGSALHFDRSPTGQNVRFAILAASFNQEDSLVFCKDAIDMGLLRSTYYKTYICEEKTSGADKEVIRLPNAETTIGMQMANYAKLNADGIVEPGTPLHEDAIIGKVMKTNALGKRDKSDTVERDRSIVVRAQNADTYMDRVIRTTNKDGNTLYKLRVRSMRRPQVGDKFSSRHGQKGTMGIALPRVDMPFFADGTCPDVIMSPHAIPSRMTIGQFFEGVLGIAAQKRGRIGNGSGFRRVTVENIAAELATLGYVTMGKRPMWDGRTGEPMEALVYSGPTYYQRLRHMTTDKVHSRGNHGPRQILTHQPVEGRARDGGLRFGEMERDAAISHGASAVLQNRLCHSSDGYVMFVCEQCGMQADPPREEKDQFIVDEDLSREDGWCNHCDTSKYIRQLADKVPYAFNILSTELAAFHIVPRMQLSDDADSI